MKAEIFDSRRCSLGEGPTSSGMGNNEVMWVDILNSKVLSRNLMTGAVSEFDCGEHVSFAIPRISDGQILGTVSGLKIREPDGSISYLPVPSSANIGGEDFPIRWNDAQVSPFGNLWLGTMTYDALPGKSSLYRLQTQTMSLERVLSGVTISNGIAWTDDSKTMFYIDTYLQSIAAFAVSNDQISERRIVIEIPASYGAPDGMSMDGEGGLWVAFWGGGQVRRFDTRNQFVTTEVIELPVPQVTSCAFAGENLDCLIITTASDGDRSDAETSGMTFICRPGVKGRPTNLFPS